MAGAIQSYRDLIVWQKGMELVETGYQLTSSFPDVERFGLISQIRRALVSVPSNIAEGHGTGVRGLYRRHLQIARGSLSEVETQLMLSERLGFASSMGARRVLQQCEELKRLLNALLRSLVRGRRPNP